ncbi:MAG: PepSY-associated TM helix domain-containing protein, partial [Geminicoccaceae bacterium]
MTTDTSSIGRAASAPSANAFYFAAWRWHFYAGLFVVPFLLVLAITGLIMLYFNSIETRFGERHLVDPVGDPLPVTDQAGAATALFPSGSLKQYIAPPTPDHAGLFSIDVDNKNMVVAVDPYTGQALGSVEKDGTWFYFASDIHGTLLIGDLGDRLMEIAAGLGIILIVTGVYLWWPRNGTGFARAFVPDLDAKGRTLWKELHVTTGASISVVLLFFLISGLAWTGIWGGQFVQAGSTFPAEKWDNVPLSDKTHATMNHGALHEVPWGLEQTRMPLSTLVADESDETATSSFSLNDTVALARDIGFDEQFRVNVPNDPIGVYTISADSMDGDTTDPMGDRTMHVDQYSGAILAEVGFADYGLAAKSMAVGIALHQGDMGLWNTILNTIFCLSIVFLTISGVVMWWKRRPSGALRLAPPPLPVDLPLWKGAVFIALLLSLAFPLVGLTLLVAMALDLLI